MADTGILVCVGDNCSAELGRVINIKINQHTRKIGVWDIEKIRLAGKVYIYLSRYKCCNITNARWHPVTYNKSNLELFYTNRTTTSDGEQIIKNN